MRRYHQPALRALFACESGCENRKSDFITRFGQDLANEARQMGKMAKFAGARFSKTTANCYNSFCHFYFILSVNRSQRPLIYHPGHSANSSGRDYFAGLKVTKRNKASVLLTLTLLQTPTLTLILTLT